MVKENAHSSAKTIAVLRDPTRGGVAAVLNEIAQQAQVGIFIRRR